MHFNFEVLFFFYKFAAFKVYSRLVGSSYRVATCAVGVP
jgi:hypothetical protein